MFARIVQFVRTHQAVSWLIVFGVIASCAVAIVVALAVSRFGDEEIETAYGRRSGPYSAQSVNGTAVLSRMFTNAGHTVRTKRLLTNAMMDQVNVIVWAPDDFTPPSEDVTQWFEQWFAHGNRTLIFIGRDCDAAVIYYDQVIPGAPNDEIGELRRRRTEARSDYASRRSATTGVHDCDWFTLDMKRSRKSIETLEGPWSEGVDASQAQIEVRGQIKPKVYDSHYDDWGYGDIDEFYTIDEDDEFGEWSADNEDEDENGEADEPVAEYIAKSSREVLLRSEDEILVSSQIVGNTSDGRLIIVTNGSFLLNLPLVNHEHRKLAARLIEQVETPETVVFLESDSSGLEIVDKEPSLDMPTGLALFAKRPIDVILFHMALLGTIFCLARWPLFGRPRAPERESVSDFGMHVEALGEMLEKTGDREFAMERLQDYQQSQGTESSKLIASDPASQRPSR